MNNDPLTNFGIRKFKKLLLWIVAVTLLLTAGLATCVVGYYVWIFYQAGKGADFVLKEADDGFKKAKATIDPEKLRAWALEEISKQSTNTNFFMSNSEIPTNIVNLYSDSPEDASVKKYNDPDQSYVEICWGGGFFHWIIDIGSTNFVETVGATNDFTTVEWVPGIYYSREDTRHPFK